MTRHFLTDTDLSPTELLEVLDLGAELKADPGTQVPFAGPGTAASGAARKTVAVIFDKTSTRTRVSFAAGIAALGGSPLIINPGEAQLGHKESIADTAQVMSRMVSMIVWRTYAQAGLEEMAATSSVPVINALSDDYHPCQLLADLLTIREHRPTEAPGGLAGTTLAYFGDGANNMANSYLLAGANAGMHVRIAAPDSHQPAAAIVERATALAAETGGSIEITDDAKAAATGADVLVTDTWVSMGQDAEGRDGADSPFMPYQVNAALLDVAAEGALVMHCLPAYRGQEITAEVIDGPQSVVFDEAENRLHAQMGLMAWLEARA
ncbi:ornithine carbamoyltransferase [Brevibacterium sp. UBA7493]|uniref:ornithine carbamoyltransferase n=1 Tax=Brevibacterium sp. UBA7493 TaxID=1946121 RepID=UPI00257CB36B|nr:ornithine carbamoyltransferase [Brevibacterium sp. UBA7493]